MKFTNNYNDFKEIKNNQDYDIDQIKMDKYQSDYLNVS